MEIGGKSCGLVATITAVILLLVGGIAVWFGAPWWTPIAALILLPIGGMVVVGLFVAMWSSSGFH